MDCSDRKFHWLVRTSYRSAHQEQESMNAVLFFLSIRHSDFQQSPVSDVLYFTYSKSHWFLNLFIGKETNSCNNLAYIPAEFTNLDPNIKFRSYNDMCYYSRTHKSSILNAFCYYMFHQALL